MHKKTPKVSVIVINVKGTEQLEKCLRCLIKTTYLNYEIIVVDCLTTNLKVWMRKFFPKVKVIHYDYDIGPSASHNVKNKITASSKYLAFLDNDACVTENWLTELVKVMEKDEKIGMAQAKILMTGNHRRLDHTGIAIDALGTWYTTRGLNADKFKKVFEIFAASSAGCIVSRRAFEEAGGFDPDYFIYDDDTDLSFRIRLLGYKIVFVPSAIIFHDARPMRVFTSKKLFHSFKNRMCTMLKNYELKNLWWRFSLYFFSTIVAGTSFLLIKKMDEAKALFRSITYSLVNIKRIWVKRSYIQFKRKVRDSELFHEGYLRNDINATLRDVRLKLKFLR